MSIKKYIYMLAGTSVLSAIALILYIIYTSPTKVQWWGIILSVLLSFTFCFSFITILGFYARLFYTNNELYYGNFLTSLRQGAEGALFTSIVLIFQVLRITNSIVILLLAATFIFFELYFQGLKE
ncbi:MAG: hypothetical protein WCP97_03085 [bacterium]